MKTAKTLFAILAITLALLSPSQAQFAYSVNASNANTITITGYTGSGGAVVIPTNINGLTVTSIGAGAFLESELTSVTIPNTVTSIGRNAFYYCPRLTSATIPNSVTSIGDSAFGSDGSLTNILIPQSVTNIGENAFYDCLRLTSLTIPNSVTSIGDYAFNFCTGITNVTIPDSVTNIGNGVFEQCFGLASVTIPGSVTSIGEWEFQDCNSLTNVTIGNGVTSIGEDAFAGCSALTGIYFSGNAPTASANTFENDGNATVYYLLGTIGWSNPFYGLPAILWNVVTTVITTQPQSLLVNAYDTASFSVTASGAEPLSYQWSLNGTNVLGANYSILTIPSATQTNLGTYTVVVTNVSGTVTSSNAVLSMYPFIATPFTGAVTYWGQSGTLSIQAWGTGPLSYQWFDNGDAIAGATNQALPLTTIQATNAGLYSVIVTSPLGTATNAPAQVIVEPAGVSLGFSPTLTISGVVGYSYIIQSSTNLVDTNGWVTVMNLILTQPVQLWVDTNVDASSPFNPTHFYQVLPGQ